MNLEIVARMLHIIKIVGRLIMNPKLRPIIFMFLVVALINLTIIPKVFAIPTLQLDIADGTYNSTTSVNSITSAQTIIAPGNPFTLYAYLIPNDRNTLADSYYISMALVPQLTPPGGNLGSFTFNTTTVNVTSDMIYGVPPLETYLGNIATFDPGDLSQHGIFNTYFYEYEFQFGSSQITPYDTQDRAISGGSISTSGSGMYYVALTVNTASLDPRYVIHFDLYNTALARRSKTDLDVTQFAPFSHDAESMPVPEPHTILFLGIGFLGLWVCRKKFGKGTA